MAENLIRLGISGAVEELLLLCGWIPHLLARFPQLWKDFMAACCILIDVIHSTGAINMFVLAKHISLAGTRGFPRACKEISKGFVTAF